MLPKHTTYKGERHILMTYNDALAEYNTRKARGKKPVIVSVHNGYIVAEAVFSEEELERG